VPIYEYQCLARKCGCKFEKFRPVNFVDQSCECPECGAPAKRLLSPPIFSKMAGAKLRKKLNAKERR